MATAKKVPAGTVRNFRGEPRVRPTVVCGPGMTKTSFKEECGIDWIMKQYRGTGVITHLNPKQAQFADVSEMGDYRTALHQVREAEDLFMQLPSKLRAKFENDAAAFLDWVTDPSTELEELKEYGLVDVVSDHPEVKLPEGEPVPGDPEGSGQAEGAAG